ncbi:unnamed protein product [Calypogeia fissa]
MRPPKHTSIHQQDRSKASSGSSKLAQTNCAMTVSCEVEMKKLDNNERTCLLALLSLQLDATWKSSDLTLQKQEVRDDSVERSPGLQGTATLEPLTRSKTGAKRSRLKHLKRIDWGRSHGLRVTRSAVARPETVHGIVETGREEKRPISDDMTIKQNDLAEGQGSNSKTGKTAKKTTSCASTSGTKPKMRTVRNRCIKELVGINFYKRIGRWTTHLWYVIYHKTTLSSRSLKFLCFHDE